ncbi:MAG: hypothetical protein ACK5NG_08250, partial [Chthoniobacterales bacterium]
MILLLGVAGCVWIKQPFSNQELLANYSRAWDFFKGFSETGDIPWWSPHFLMGFPLSYQMTVFFSNVLLGTFSMAFGYLAGPKIIILICFGFAAFGMGFFMLQVTKDRWVALTATILTLGLPSWITRLAGVEHFVVIASLAVLPWCFSAFFYFFKSPSLASALLAGILYSLLFLSYAKTAVLATPLLLIFCGWCYFRNASFLRPKPVLLFLVFLSILLLAFLPALPAVRESGIIAGFFDEPLQAWQKNFSNKTALSWLDYDRFFTQNMSGTFDTVAIAGSFPGLPTALIGFVFFLFFRRRIEEHSLGGCLKLFLALSLVAFWLSFGPNSILGGQMKFLELASSAPHYSPAVSWGMIAFQAWLIFFLLPNALPGKTLVGIIFCGICFLIPGFRLLNWIPPYDDIRAPYDFFQIIGPVFTIASAALMLRIIISSEKNKYIFPFRKTAVNFGLIVLVLVGWIMDVKVYARPLWKSPLSNELYEAFLETCEYLKKEKEQGWLYPVSDRYFYQMIPVLSGVPLAQEAFNGYLQPKNTAVLQTYFLSRDHLRAFFNIAGVTYIFIDKTDSGLSENYQQLLEGYFEKSFSNDYFTVLKNPDSMKGAFIANETVELTPEDPTSLSNGLLVALDNQLAVNFDRVSKNSSETSDTQKSDSKKSIENAQFTPLKLKERSYKKLVPEKASVPGCLVATTSWHPDWTANVNGKKTPIFRALNAFPAVAVEAGDEVVFEFQPPAWYSACLWGALGSWFVLPLIVCLPASWRKLRGEAFEEMPARDFSVQRPLVVI